MKKRIIAKVVFKRSSPDVKSYLFKLEDNTITLRTMVLYHEGEDVGRDFGNIKYCRFGKRLVQRDDCLISQETIDAMHYLSHLNLVAPEDGIIIGKMSK